MKKMDTNGAEQISYNQFPATALREIVRYLPVRDRLIFAEVCQCWRTFILQSSSAWQSICIDCSTPFGGEWKPVTLRYELNFSEEYYMLEKQHKSIMDKFIFKLASKTNLIESIRLELRLDGISPKSIHRLLMSQRKLVTLSIDRLNFMNGAEFQQTEIIILNAIGKHQKTIERLELHNAPVSLRNWNRLLASAEFPSLRAISFPWNFNDLLDSDDTESVLPSITAIEEVFHHILKHGKVEEINMAGGDFEASTWCGVLSNPLKQLIRKGFTRNLRKLSLDSISDHAFGSPDESEKTASDSDMLIQNCPYLTHLHCYLNCGYARLPVTQKGPFIELVTHYSTNLVSLSCGIDDRVADIIAKYCENLTTLTAAGHEGVENLPHALTNKGLFSLSKLKKLEDLNLIVDWPEPITSSGVVKLLLSLVGNLKKLALQLPCLFYNDKNIYDTLCSNTSSLLGSLSFTFSSVPLFMGQNNSQRLLNGNTLLEGIQKVIKNCHPLKHFSVNKGHLFCGNEKPEKDLIKAIFQSVVTFHSGLESFSFDIGVKIPEDHRQFIIEMLPYCNITLSHIRNVIEDSESGRILGAY